MKGNNKEYTCYEMKQKHWELFIRDSIRMGKRVRGRHICNLRLPANREMQLGNEPT
jgi:hypothetical protein